MHILHWGFYKALWNVGLLNGCLLWSVHGFTPSWVCSSLRVVQMCTPLALPQSCLYSNEFSSALTKHVLLCLCDRCVCISLHSLCLCLEMQKYNLPSQFSKCMTRLFDTTVNKEGFKEMKMYAQPACVCVPILEWNCGCSYFLYGHMWLHCSDMLSCPDLRLKTASSLSCGGSPMSFLTQNSYL